MKQIQLEIDFDLLRCEIEPFLEKGEALSPYYLEYSASEDNVLKVTLKFTIV